MAPTHRIRSVALVALAVGLGTATGRTASPDPSLHAVVAATVARAGERVEAFFGRAQNLVCTETVSILPLDQGLKNGGFARTIESELRVWWNPSSDGMPSTVAQTRRQVLKVNRRAPAKNDRNNCTAPEQIEAETQPLSMLLSHQRSGYEFSLAGTARVDGRAATMVDFKDLTPLSVDVRTVEANEDCVAYDVNGGFRGRLWIDNATFEQPTKSLFLNRCDNLAHKYAHDQTRSKPFGNEVKFAELVQAEQRHA